MMTVGFLFCVFIVFYFALLEGGYLYKGKRRGEYIEKSEWRVGRTSSRWKQLDDGILIWNGPVTFSNVVPQTEVATFTLAPDSGRSTIPVLCGPDESDVRRMVNDELCSTPIFTGLKYGGFGDSDFDRVDSARLCAPATTWLPGDQ